MNNIKKRIFFSIIIFCFIGIFGVPVFAGTTIEDWEYQKSMKEKEGQENHNNNDDSSSSGSDDSSTSGDSSNSYTPSTPSIPTYPDPTEGMDEATLQEIASNGTPDQKQKANEIIQEIEHEKKDQEYKNLGNEIKTESTDLILQETENPVVPEAAKIVPKEGKGSETESAKAKLKAQSEEAKTVILENKNEEENVQNSGNADEKGDPVRITQGIYEQNETDIGFVQADGFYIKRKYMSDCMITSSFGYGWLTNIDERIILGTDAHPEKNAENLRDYSETLINLITQYENELELAYEIDDLYSAVDVFKERKALSLISLTEQTKLLNSARELLLDTIGYSAHDAIIALEGELINIINELEQKIIDYDQAITYLTDHLSNLKAYKQQYEESLLQISEYEPIYNLSMQRKARNSKVMFPGMPSGYEETGLDTITLINEDGYPYLFIQSESTEDVWETKFKNYISLRKTEKGFLLLQADGITKEFDEQGFIVSIKDRNSNSVYINRKEDEKIDSIENSFGERLKFEYKNGFIWTITNVRDSSENVVYTYKGNKLEAVKDTDGDVVTLGYDTEGRMTSLLKCDGSTVVFEYGEETADGKKLTTSTTNEENETEYFYYDRAQVTLPGIGYNGLLMKTTYIDHDKNETVSWFDEKHRTRYEQKQDGSSIVYHYDDKDNLDYVNENGSFTYFGYDTAGRKIRAGYDDNSYETWTYDEYGALKSYRDRDGVVYTYVRDSMGNLKEYWTGNKKVLSRIIDSKGLVKQQTVYGQYNIVTDYTYDAFGNVETETCGGVKTFYKYDKRNRLEIIKVNDVPMTSYEYKGNKTIRKDFGKLTTTYLTNGRKDITQIIQKDEVTGVVHKTRIEYDRRHLPLRVYTGDGTKESLAASYIYTAEGKVRAQILHGSESWVTMYDYSYGQISGIKQFKTSALPDAINAAVSNNAVIGNNGVVEPVETTFTNMLRAAGNDVYTQKYTRTLYGKNEFRLAVTDGLGITSLFEYDSWGNFVKMTDGNGETTGALYKASGRLKEEQSLYGGWYEYGYDTAGLLMAAGEKDGKTVSTDYYPDGSINKTTDRYGKTTYYNYDNRGRTVNVQSDSQKIWYEYDGFDRVTKQIVGNTKSESSAVYYAAYAYSSDGRTVTVTEGGKYKTVYNLDAFGNVVKETDGNGNTRRYEYDSQNQLVAEYDGYENKTVYEYNALGEVSKVTLPDGTETNYVYNYMGLLEKVTDGCGTVYTAVYDKAGRLKKERTRADSEKSYEYDDGGRIKKVLCGGEVVESYTYRENGRVVTVKDGNGNDYVYNYDSFGRLKNEKNRIGLTQSYLYDDEGQLKSQTNFDGSTTTIVYSENMTVRTVKYSEGLS